MRSQPWHFSQPSLADQNRLDLVRIAYALAQAWIKKLSQEHPEHSLIAPLDPETRALLGTLENPELLATGDDTSFHDYALRLQWAVWSYLALLARTALPHQTLFELMAQASYDHGKTTARTRWNETYNLAESWKAVTCIDPFQWTLSTRSWVTVSSNPQTEEWRAHPGNSHLSIIKLNAAALTSLCVPYYQGCFHGMKPDTFVEWNQKQHRLQLRVK